MRPAGGPATSRATPSAARSGCGCGTTGSSATTPCGGRRDRGRAHRGPARRNALHSSRSPATAWWATPPTPRVEDSTLMPWPRRWTSSPRATRATGMRRRGARRSRSRSRTPTPSTVTARPANLTVVGNAVGLSTVGDGPVEVQGSLVHGNAITDLSFTGATERAEVLYSNVGLVGSATGPVDGGGNCSADSRFLGGGDYPPAQRFSRDRCLVARLRKRAMAHPSRLRGAC